ncbi:hypothetical protein BV394_06345 [Brevirhabdus pacifica]|uniref:Uncharacterized protein n=1 Tax=Brevirhabdus pacifica TaxID=1267768 RepID=A0A1U7DHE3_9RHOB|nr:hypothetical protein [Brevirhabdus pacifica]APX89381.1 hypothetical protein BV394_06345 [Brevirhabdus pacifica]OWU76594.1 hypothetical protein ATO5_09945 [Loktanella sp. 22II-4b]PJJ85984.1 hypothetical protein CLV77_0516 [Brevirhabdus pacifica]
MGRAAPIPLIALIVGATLALSAPGLLRGGLVVTQHEGDLLHLLQILMLMQEGQWPHLDFRTPVGLFAFLPLHWTLALGRALGFEWGLGQALIVAQLGLGLLLAPVIWWVARSRLVGWAAVAAALVPVIWLTALIHGGTNAGVSVSMHYNRWAWAVALLAVVTAVLPPRAAGGAGMRAAGIIDAAVIGIGFAILGLTKATFAVTLAPAVIVALVLRGRGRVLAGALVAGLLFCAGVALFMGAAFWPAYVGDLLWVAGMPVRPFPDQPLGAVIGGPAFIPGTFLLLGAVVVLRLRARPALAWPVLLLAPSFVYITYQNFGNDPKWLILLALLLAPLLSRQGDAPAPDLVQPSARPLVAGLVLAAAVLGAGSLFNMARSVLANGFAGPAETRPIFAAEHMGRDLLSDPLRLARLDIALAGEEAPAAMVPLLPPFADDAEGRPNTTTFLGRPLPTCGLDKGMIAHQRGLAEVTAKAIGPGGGRVFVTDLFSALWVFGGSSPVTPLAPWNYGALTGIDSAGFVAVPLCPVNPPVRKRLLEELEAGAEAGRWELTPVPAGPGLWLYAIAPG